MKLPWSCWWWRWLPEDVKLRLLYTEQLATNLFAPLPVPTKYTFVSHAQGVLNYPTFVETGTYLGGMSRHASHLFRKVHTIELGPELARQAKTELADLLNVTVHQGDSGELLPALLESIDTPCVFWLDGHFSGGSTARGSKETPIIAELEAIAASRVRPHTVFIDDARVFGADDAYPTLELVFPLLHRIDPEFRIGVSSDIIWAAPVKILHFEWSVSPLGIVVPPTTARGLVCEVADYAVGTCRRRR